MSSSSGAPAGAPSSAPAALNLSELEHGLPPGWQTAERLVLLDTAFGHGRRFLACLQAWRKRCSEPGAHAGVLHFIALLPQLPAQAELAAAWQGEPDPRRACELLAIWPPATPDLHRLAFDGGAVQLLLVSGPLRDRLPQLVARVDAFSFDATALAGDDDPAWPKRLFKAAARLAAPSAGIRFPAADQRTLAALRSAGFELVAAPASTAGHEARFAPRHTPRAAARPSQPAPIGVAREALIVGGGLAGCAAAWALAEQGWHSTVLDRQPAPAAEASGNPAGLFHGIVNAQDGAHARFNRAAALEAARAVRTAIERHGVTGSTAGLLRLETALPDAAAMQALLARLGLPADYVDALTTEAASRLAGMPLAHPCWHYPGGGWVDPAGLARAFLERAGPRSRFRGGVDVAALRRTPDGKAWDVLAPSGECVGTSATVVLAMASDAARLLAAAAATPFRRVRGQLSVLPEARRNGALPGLVLPRLPVAGSGYLLPAVHGAAVFGATAQPGDDDASVRDADHRLNLAALARLTGLEVLPAVGALPALQGRTAWRSVTADRLPVIGAVADGSAFTSNATNATNATTTPLAAVPRLPGLFTFHALGSRGITWAALGGQVLAAAVSGAPQPLLAPLLAALDPARFIRRQRGAAAETGSQAG